MAAEAWRGSNRRAELPKDWSVIRERILRRDQYRCTAQGPGGRCSAIATDCDHIGDKLDHSDSNLRSLCSAHHAARTAQQSAAARAARKVAARRPPARHPGSLL
jgi:5-methylcytosine-specific restriction enzyme A